MEGIWSILFNQIRLDIRKTKPIYSLLAMSRSIRY